MSDRVKLISGEPDGATAIGYEFDTTFQLTTAGALVYQWKHLGTQVMAVDGDNNNQLIVGPAPGFTPQPTSRLVVNGSLLEVGNGSSQIGLCFASGNEGAYIADGSLFWMHFNKGAGSPPRDQVFFDKVIAFGNNQFIQRSNNVSGSSGPGAEAMKFETETSLSGDRDRLFTIKNSGARTWDLMHDGSLIVGGASYTRLGALGTPSKATATITVIDNSIDAGDAITIGAEGVTYTVTEGVEWAIGGDADATATNIANAINAKATLNEFVSANAVTNVVTVTATYAGSSGNLITIAESDGATDNFTLSDTILTGGDDDGLGFVLNVSSPIDNSVADERLFSLRNGYIEMLSVSPRGGVNYKRRSVASSQNTAGEVIFGCDTTGGAVTLTLDSDDMKEGRIVYIKDEGNNAGTNNITIATEGAETIDGAATLVISTNRGHAKLYADGTNWQDIT